MSEINFSVLCSLYHKENPDYLGLCLQSVANQTKPPAEVIVVHDGKLTTELYRTLDAWRSALNIIDVPLAKNVGLGLALNEGLKRCNYNLVARVDTDDINDKERFLKQLRYMNSNPEVAAVSSHVWEFDCDPTMPSHKKNVPIGSGLKDFSLMRNPLNHMAVMFRKDAIDKVHGYRHLQYMEDYYLWLRLLSSGYKLDNIDDVLVFARVGNGMLERRRGVNYAFSELRIMLAIYRLGLTKSPKTFFAFIFRALSRLLPKSILAFIYERKVRSSSN